MESLSDLCILASAFGVRWGSDKLVVHNEIETRFAFSEITAHIIGLLYLDFWFKCETVYCRMRPGKEINLHRRFL